MNSLSLDVISRMYSAHSQTLSLKDITNKFQIGVFEMIQGSSQRSNKGKIPILFIHFSISQTSDTHPFH